MADRLATPQELASLLQINYDTLSGEEQQTLAMLVELATSKVQRAAGGQRIVEATDTAVIDVPPFTFEQELSLPQLPVQQVLEVRIDGEVVTDWKLSNQKLWRITGWNLTHRPVRVAVTSKHGYAADSQWLQLAKESTLSLARMPYTNPSGAMSEAIDDYRVSYAAADARMEVTEHMRDSLLAAYGVNTYVISSR